MEIYFQILIPIITLVLGYFLNVWKGSIESKREVTRRRITEKEKAYSKLTEKLHQIFDAYYQQTLRKTTEIAGTPLWGPPNESLIPKMYDELNALVYEHSLYLKPSIIQALVDLKLIDFRMVFQHINENRDESRIEQIKFLEQHADTMWSKTKMIISEMRKELGLEEYPDELLKLWR